MVRFALSIKIPSRRLEADRPASLEARRARRGCPGWREWVLDRQVVRWTHSSWSSVGCVSSRCAGRGVAQVSVLSNRSGRAVV